MHLDSIIAKSKQGEEQKIKENKKKSVIADIYHKISNMGIQEDDFKEIQFDEETEKRIKKFEKQANTNGNNIEH